MHNSWSCSLTRPSLRGSNETERRVRGKRLVFSDAIKNASKKKQTRPKRARAPFPPPHVSPQIFAAACDYDPSASQYEHIYFLSTGASLNERNRSTKELSSAAIGYKASERPRSRRPPASRGVSSGLISPHSSSHPPSSLPNLKDAEQRERAEAQP